MISAKKSLGQHFLRDSNITDKIVRLCGDLSALNIVEIGPGPGALTRSILAAKPLSYTGIEKDERVAPMLHELFALHPAPCTLHLGDALKISLPATVSAPRAEVATVAVWMFTTCRRSAIFIPSPNAAGNHSKCARAA